MIQLVKIIELWVYNAQAFLIQQVGDEIKTWAWWGAPCKTIPFPKIFGSESPETEAESETQTKRKQKLKCDIILCCLPLQVGKQLIVLDLLMVISMLFMMLLQLLLLSNS